MLPISKVISSIFEPAHHFLMTSYFATLHGDRISQIEHYLELVFFGKFLKKKSHNFYGTLS